MSGFRVLIAGIDMEGEGQPEPSVNSLETGIIHRGDASGIVGDAAWMDGSDGTFYGGGERYDRLEMPFIAKVRSNNR